MATSPAKGWDRKRRGCQIKLSATISVPNTTTMLLVPLNSAVFDDSLFSVGGNRIEIKVAGRYMVTAQVRWSYHSAGDRALKAEVAGPASESYVHTMTRALIYGSDEVLTAISLVQLYIGQYVQLYARQSSGSTRSILPDLTFLSVVEV